MNIHPEYKEFLKLLIDEQVEFLLIGGFAVAHYGYVRNTQDIDFLYRNDPPNNQRICNVLEQFGISKELIDPAVVEEPGNILRIGIKPVRIELLNRISGVSFDEAWDGRVQVELDGLTVPVIGLTELLTNKKASGRPKDLADVDELGGTLDSPAD